ncbi:hypothetical protein RhoFasGS6_03873 [Rhodococcus fascians]|uniref:AAA family ATPase n=1 Tax=Rhodococcoides fascians TaxID=1828 RepID=UPI001427D360|nr:hypothetical protein [Rhodococcus fascians]
MTKAYEPAWFQALDARQQRRAMRWVRGAADRPAFLPDNVVRPVPKHAPLQGDTRYNPAASPPSESLDAMVARMASGKNADKLATARANAEAKVAGAMRSRADLATMPALEPLVDGFLYLDTVARLVGPPGSYKSFLALDWAASVATGTPWHGQAVAKGGVVYLVGEGVRGIDARLTAWERHRLDGKPAEVEVFDGIVDLAAPQTDAAEWVALARLLFWRKPSLIVVDTQARYTPGHEENSSTDMGILVNNLDALRRGTGACVLLVHHTTRGTEHARGSTAIEGGVQTELVMTPGKRGTVKLKTEKQKDIEEPEPVELHAVAVEGTTSIVLDSADLGVDPLDLPATERVNATSPIYERLARVIVETFNHGTTGCTKVEAKAALQADHDLKITGDPRTVGKRFPQAWSTLESRGHLEMVISAATGNPVMRYKITAAYAAELDLGEA